MQPQQPQRLLTPASFLLEGRWVVAVGQFEALQIDAAGALQVSLTGPEV